MNEQLSFEDIQTSAGEEIKSDTSFIVQAEDVQKSYFSEMQELKVLKDINLDFTRGEFVCIVGPSGAGKSTLLHLLGLLDTPTGGDVYFEGEKISGLGETALARIRNQKIGFIFQSYHLLPEFNTLENVLMPFYIREATFNVGSSFVEKAKDILTKVGLGKRLYHRPSQLSGGEQQRAAIARSLVNDPDLILADEPTGNLDYKTSQEIMTLLYKINALDKKTLIIVTHNEEYTKRAHRVIKLRDGRVV